MIGPFDNETRTFVRYDELLDLADWYLDVEGCLYILPPPDAVMEAEGPDNDIMDYLCAFSADHGHNPRPEEAHSMGLRYVHAPLRRFSEQDGYFSA